MTDANEIGKWNTYFDACRKNDLISAFDALADLGMRPLPIGAGTDGKIKIPQGTNWGNQPMSNRRGLLVHMIDEQVPVGIGVQPDGYIVVDIDPPAKDTGNLHTAWSESAQLIFRQDDWPDTLIVRTAGGCHLWYKATPALMAIWPKGGRIVRKLACGGQVEFFSGGVKQCQVACSPSEGKQIAREIEPVTVPQALADMIGDILEPKGCQDKIAKELEPSIPVKPDTLMEWFADRLDKLTVRVSEAPEGSRHDTFRACVRVAAGYAAALGIDGSCLDLVYNQLADARLANDPEATRQNTQATFDWAWSRGLECPLKLPVVRPTPVKPVRGQILPRVGTESGGSGDFSGEPTVNECSELFYLQNKMLEHAETYYRYCHVDRRYVELTDVGLESVVSAFIVDYLASRPVVDRHGDAHIKDWSTQFLRNVVSRVKALVQSNALNLEERPVPDPEGLINFANGILDWHSGILTPHDDSYFLTRRTDWEWPVFTADQDIPEPTEFFKFLDSIFGNQSEDSKLLILQFIGYLLSGGTSLHKGLMIVGPPRSGKGTLLTLIENIVGQSLTAIADNTTLKSDFGVADFIGKRLIVMPDYRYAHSNDASDVAAANSRILSITANDPMSLNRKYRNPWKGRLGAVMAIASNEMPRWFDGSTALANRFVYLRTQTSYLGREDYGLIDRLQAEIPLIAVWARAQFFAMLAGTGRLAELPIQAEAVSEMADIGNPLREFLRDTYEPIPVPKDPASWNMGDYLLSSDVYGSYKQWCESNGYKHVMAACHLTRNLKMTASGLVDGWEILDRKIKLHGTRKTAKVIFGLRQIE